jgi:hypothetical protein
MNEYGDPMLTIIITLWLLLLIGVPLFVGLLLWNTSRPSEKRVTRLRKAGL